MQSLSLDVDSLQISSRSESAPTQNVPLLSETSRAPSDIKIKSEVEDLPQTSGLSSPHQKSKETRTASDNKRTPSERSVSPEQVLVQSVRQIVCEWCTPATLSYLGLVESGYPGQRTAETSKGSVVFCV